LHSWFGGVVAWLGASMAVQLLVTGALALAGSFAAHRWRERKGTPPPQAGLDIGQPVQVQLWREDGTARVLYRGTQWDAELSNADVTRERTMYIVAMRGSTLVITPDRPVA
jgi:membrane protein implicated in regulation of membrane protease activity